MNKLVITILSLTIVCVIGCKTTLLHMNNKTIYPEETPFMIVVKLNSAEESLKYDIALQYMDVDKVYRKSKDPISDWKKMLLFNYKIGKDPKFTNSFSYHDYIINEKIHHDKAYVSFINKNASPIKEIKYILENRNDRWIVVAIKYIKE